MRLIDILQFVVLSTVLFWAFRSIEAFWQRRRNPPAEEKTYVRPYQKTITVSGHSRSKPGQGKKSSKKKKSNKKPWW